MGRVRAKTKQQLHDENEDLRARLAEAQQALRAPCGNAGDARLVASLHNEAADSLVTPAGAVTLDGTDQGPAPAALSENEERFRALAENMPHFVWEADPRGTPLYANRRFLNYSGLSLEQVQAGGWLMAQHPDDASHVAAAWRHAVANATDYDLESRFREAASGQYRWFRIKGSPVRDGAGRIIRWVGTCTDIDDAKRAEERLAKVASFPLLNPNPIVEADLEGNVSFVNPAARRTFPDIEHRGPSHPFLAQWRELAAACCQPGAELPARELSVGDRWYHQTLFYSRENSRIRIYGLDITKRKQAEEAWRRAKEEWERTFDTLPDLIAILDREHRIVRANRAMLERLGTPPEECQGRVCYHCVHGTDGPPEYCPYVRTLADGQEHTAEIHDRQLGGDFLVTTTPLRDAQGRPVGSVHVARDITERKHAEDRGRLLSAVTAQLLSSDQPQQVVESLCRQVAAHLGCHVFFNYLVDEASGRLHLNACAGIPDDTARQIEWLDCGTAVCGCVARDGHPIVVERIQAAADPRTDLVRALGIQAYACHPLLNQGRVIGTLSFGARTKPVFGQDELAVMKTVADQVAIALQRLRLLEASQQHARAAEAANAAKDQFLANVSHELRTPMAAILGMTDLALAAELDPAVRDYLKMAKESADGLMQLLNELLDFSRIEAGGFQLEAIPFRLRTVLDQTLKTLGVRAAEKGLDLVCDLSEELPNRLVGDPLRLRQILTNLVGNAIKFTAQGEVVVRVTALPIPAEERRDNGAAEVLLRFDVTDTGMGIAPDDQQRIFAPFTQVDASTTRQYGGTGLGLTIVSSLVRLMDGRIGVESEVGRGSTFHFTARFPLAPSSPAQPAVEPLAADQLCDVPVLVVDDHPENRRMLADLLRGWSMRPEVADHAPAALAKIQQALAAGRTFPLMIIDALMPDIDGLTLIQWIRADRRLSGAVILMVSSADRSVLADRLRTLDVAAFLEKPIRHEALFEAITRTLGSAAQHEPPAAETARPAAGCAPRRLRVLLAEDTIPNQKLVVAILSERGHTVHLAPNGREAIAMVEQQDFDLALMDVQMPIVDGLQATAAIRALPDPAKARLPIVAMTAHAMVGDQQRCLAAGMDAYLTKPITSQVLIETVERLAGQAEPPPAAPPPASPEPPEPPDRAVEVFNGQAALARLGGRGNLLQDMIDFFFADAPVCLADIQAGLQDQAPSAVAQAAHRLKGTLVYLGAESAVQAVQRVEQMGHHGDLPNAAAASHVLAREIARLEQALRSWREGHPAAPALTAE